MPFDKFCHFFGRATSIYLIHWEMQIFCLLLHIARQLAVAGDDVMHVLFGITALMVDAVSLLSPGKFRPFALPSLLTESIGRHKPDSLMWAGKIWSDALWKEISFCDNQTLFWQCQQIFDHQGNVSVPGSDGSLNQLIN